MQDPTARIDLFILKIQQCCTIFDFNDPKTDQASLEMKTETLREISDYLLTLKGPIPENICSEIFKMVKNKNQNQLY